MAGTVHIIGAGLAGLSAAIRLVERGERVIVHEAANQAGGRCRSYHDPSLDMMIDNGNHLVLSGNHAALSYIAAIGASDRLVGAPHADFPFVDLKTDERWTLRINDGRLPWWIFAPNRRVPGARLSEYLAAARLLNPPAGAVVGDLIDCSGPLYNRLLRPLLVGALNTDPREATATLAAAILKETVGVGGRACRPMIAADGLGAAFVEPALRLLDRAGAAVQFGHRLRAVEFGAGRATALQFGDEPVALGPADRVVLAAPPVVAAALIPGLAAPSEFHAIVNAHFKIVPPAGVPPFRGVVNGTVEWVFAYADRLSVTISAADRLVDTPREELARTIWREVAAACEIGNIELPPWQIVRERRATFAALPDQESQRPGPSTAWNNLVLAGDWTATGLPATIEGAIRSGEWAARLVLGQTR